MKNVLNKYVKNGVVVGTVANNFFGVLSLPSTENFQIFEKNLGGGILY